MDDLSGLSSEPSGAFDSDLYNLTSPSTMAAPAEPVDPHSPDQLPKGYIPMYPKGAKGPEDIHWGVPADKLKDAHGMGMELAVPVHKQGDASTTWVPLSQFHGREKEFTDAGYALHPTYSSLFAGETRGLAGATANTIDVAIPALSAAVESVYGTGPSKPWAELYGKHRNAALARKEISEEMAPGASLAGQVVGGAIPGAAAGTGIAANAALGAVQGASGAAVEGQDAAHVAKEAAKSGAISGAFAGLLNAGGKAVNWLQAKGVLPKGQETAERELLTKVVKPSMQEGESFEQTANRVAAHISAGAESPIEGVQRTTAQAGAGIPALAQHENLAASRTGTKAASALADMADRSKRAMVEAVQARDVADETLATARAARGTDADAAYKAATMTEHLTPETAAVMKARHAIETDPLLAPAVSEADKVNASLGHSYDDADGGMRAYDILKRNIDAAIGQAKRVGNDTVAMALKAKNDALVSALDAASPGYHAAREQFANDTQALAQSQAMANVSRKAAPPGASSVSLPGMTAARKANVGQLAGEGARIQQPNEKFLSPDVQGFFDNVRDEIQRQAHVRAQGVAGGNSATAARQHGHGAEELTGIVAARGIPVVGDVLEKIFAARHFITQLNSKPEQEAALHIFTNPQHAAEVLRNLTAEQQNNVQTAVKAMAQSAGRTPQVQQPVVDELQGLF